MCTAYTLGQWIHLTYTHRKSISLILF